MSYGNQSIDLLCVTVDLFTYDAFFNAGGYFQMDSNALICGSFSAFYFYYYCYDYYIIIKIAKILLIVKAFDV